MYEEFAAVYDEFMQDVPYDTWADYIEELWKKHYPSERTEAMPQLVLDLACGTGTLTLELADRGYEMIAADQSEDMLSEAREKAMEQEKQILFLNQSMQELELYGTVDAVVCTCDSLNYLTEEEDVQRVFSLVENYLNPGGLFIFDVNTEYKFETVLADHTQSQVYEDAAYIWENYYYSDEKINEYTVTFFRETESGLYERSEEVHYEKAYSTEQLKQWLEQAHMEIVGIYDAFSMEAPKKDSERICFVARETREKRTS